MNTAAKTTDEYSARIEQIELKAGDDGAPLGIIEGYASRFGEKDDGNDIVVRGAYKETLKKRGAEWVPFLYGHNRQGFPIGHFLELAEDSVGLRFKAQLLTECEGGKVIFALAKAGAKLGVSIGYRTIRKEIVVPASLGGEGSEYSPGAIRKLLEIDLQEISVVPVPMLKTAIIDGAKAEGGGESGEKQAVYAAGAALIHALETGRQSFALRQALENAAARFGR